jgi:hypothetical protein
MLITRKLRRQTTIVNEPLYCTSFGDPKRGNLSYVAGLSGEIIPSIVATVRGNDGREYRVRLTADDIDAINRARHELYGGAEYAWPPAWLPSDRLAERERPSIEPATADYQGDHHRRVMADRPEGCLCHRVASLALCPAHRHLATADRPKGA